MADVRMCKVFYCDARGDRYCCRDCLGYEVCANRCLNHPNRCRLVQGGNNDGEEVQRRRIRKIKSC